MSNPELDTNRTINRNVSNPELDTNRIINRNVSNESTGTRVYNRTKGTLPRKKGRPTNEERRIRSLLTQSAYPSDTPISPQNDTQTTIQNMRSNIGNLSLVNNDYLDFNEDDLLNCL